MDGPVLVTGATGFIGAHLVRALVARELEVRCLVRDGSPARSLEGLPVRQVTGDVRDRPAVDRAARGCATVFHCAADYRLWARDPKEMVATNVEGTRNVLAAAAHGGVRRVVYTSSVATLVPGTAEAPSTEGDVAREVDRIGPYKQSKFAAEQAALTAASNGQDVVIVNPSTPVGELDRKPTPTGRIIVDFMRGRMPAWVDTGLNLIDVRDVAEGHVLAAERGVSGERYILGNRNMSFRSLLEALSAASGRPAPRLRLPHWIPLAAAALGEGLARLGGPEPRVSLAAARMAKRTMYFDSGKAVRDLGLPQSSIEEALERAVAWFRAAGYAP